MRKILILALITAFAGGGCSKKPPAKVDCAPSGSVLALVAKDTTFDKKCLAAAAGKDFQIQFDNQDADTHNVAIYESPAKTKKLFGGDIKRGPAKVTYDVTALDAGRYYFQCDVHPDQMTGTFIVK